MGYYLIIIRANLPFLLHLLPFWLLACLHHLHEPFYHIGILVGEEGALTTVESIDALHLIVGESKVEDVEIVDHVLFVATHWEDDNASLHMPTQYDLM